MRLAATFDLQDWSNPEVGQHVLRAMTMEKRFWLPMPGDILLTRNRALGGRANSALSTYETLAVPLHRD